MATTTTPPSAPPPMDGDALYEVVDGQVVEKTVGSFEADIASLLDQYLGSFVRSQRLGKVVVEMLFRIDVATNLQRRPDVAFISQERWPWWRRAPREPVWDMVPDLAIEIVSPSNSAREIQDKLRKYFQAGARRVWVVYPDDAFVYIYDSPTVVRILQRGDELADESLLPGFRLAVAALFDDDAEPR